MKKIIHRLAIDWPRVSMWSPFLIIVVLVFIHFSLSDSLRELISYHRIAIGTGEWWRLWSGSLLHLDTPHLLMNVFGVGLWWLLFAEYFPEAKYYWRILVFMGCSSVLQFIADPGTVYYFGFSGAVYAMFAYGGVRDTLIKRWSGLAIVAAQLGKVTYDSFTLPSDADIALAAHWGGILSGYALAAIDRYREFTATKRNQ